MSKSKSLQEQDLQLADLEKKIQAQQKVLANRLRQAKARNSSAHRKARNKRLIEKGAVLENFQAELYGHIHNLKPVSRVLKKDDPTGKEYEAYKNYREAVRAKEEWNEKITPKQSSKWLRQAQESFDEIKKALAETKNASQELKQLTEFVKSVTDDSGTSVYDMYLENQRISSQSQNTNGAEQNEH